MCIFIFYVFISSNNKLVTFFPSFQYRMGANYCDFQVTCSFLLPCRWWSLCENLIYYFVCCCRIRLGEAPGRWCSPLWARRNCTWMKRWPPFDTLAKQGPSSTNPTSSCSRERRHSCSKCVKQSTKQETRMQIFAWKHCTKLLSEQRSQRNFDFHDGVNSSSAEAHLHVDYLDEKRTRLAPHIRNLTQIIKIAQKSKWLGCHKIKKNILTATLRDKNDNYMN